MENAVRTRLSEELRERLKTELRKEFVKPHQRALMLFKEYRKDPDAFRRRDRQAKERRAEAKRRLDQRYPSRRILAVAYEPLLAVASAVFLAIVSARSELRWWISRMRLFEHRPPWEQKRRIFWFVLRVWILYECTRLIHLLLGF